VLASGSGMSQPPGLVPSHVDDPLGARRESDVTGIDGALAAPHRRFEGSLCALRRGTKPGECSSGEALALRGDAY
jgi:hypothetical protein